MKDDEKQKTILIIFCKSSCKKCGYLDKNQKETIITCRQESETDEEREKALLTLAQRTCAYVTCGKRALTKLFAVSDS